MALVFAYAKVAAKPRMGNIIQQRAKAKAAIVKKSLPDKIADEFLDQVGNDARLQALLANLEAVVRQAKQNTLGYETLQNNLQSPIIRKVFAQIVAKQLLVKFKDVYLEIHIKASKLELWFHAKGGQKEVVCTWSGKL